MGNVARHALWGRNLFLAIGLRHRRTKVKPTAGSSNVTEVIHLLTVLRARMGAIHQDAERFADREEEKRRKRIEVLARLVSSGRLADAEAELARLGLIDDPPSSRAPMPQEKEAQIRKFAEQALSEISHNKRKGIPQKKVTADRVLEAPEMLVQYSDTLKNFEANLGRLCPNVVLISTSNLIDPETIRSGNGLFRVRDPYSKQFHMVPLKWSAVQEATRRLADLIEALKVAPQMVLGDIGECREISKGKNKRVPGRPKGPQNQKEASLDKRVFDARKGGTDFAVIESELGINDARRRYDRERKRRNRRQP